MGDWGCVGRAIAVAIILGHTTQAARFATYYVSGQGRDSNNGLSTTTSLRTLQAAADRTLPGDAVYVMNGIYTNADPNWVVVDITHSGTASAPITYQAYPGAKPQLRFDGWSGFKLENGASHITISGFDIEGANQSITLDYAISQQYIANPLTNGSGIAIDGRYSGANRPHHIRIANNIIHDCPGGGISAIQADYVTIEDNIVFNTSWYTIYATSGISIYQAWNSDNSIDTKMFVRRNRTYGNREYIP